jgi:hypothetical protein
MNIMSINEEWRPVIENGKITNYLVSNYGDVKNNNEVLLTKTKAPQGLKVTLFIDGKKHGRLVHRLVATAFVINDDPINKKIVHHIDNNKLNNVADNLEWVTQSDSVSKNYRRSFDVLFVEQRFRNNERH